MKENAESVVKVAKKPKVTTIPEASAFPTKLDKLSVKSGINISENLWDRFIKYKEEKSQPTPSFMSSFVEQ